MKILCKQHGNIMQHLAKGRKGKHLGLIFKMSCCGLNLVVIYAFFILSPNPKSHIFRSYKKWLFELCQKVLKSSKYLLYFFMCENSPINEFIIKDKLWPICFGYISWPHVSQPYCSQFLLGHDIYNNKNHKATHPRGQITIWNIRTHTYYLP